MLVLASLSAPLHSLHFYKAGKLTCIISLKSSARSKLPLTAATEFLSMFCYIQLFFIEATTLLVVGFICKASLFLSKPHTVNYSYHSAHIETHCFSLSVTL